MSDRSREEMEAHKAIVRAFLVRCRDWAQQREIPKRTRQLAKTPNAEGAAKLHAWISYDHFLEHTLDELADGTLDHWFLDGVTEYNTSEGDT